VGKTQTLTYTIKVLGTDTASLSVQELVFHQKELQRLLLSLPAEGTEAYNTLDKEVREATDGTQTLASVQKDLNNQFSQGRQRVLDFNKSLRQGTAAAGSINDLRNRLVGVRRELDNTAQTVKGQVNPEFQELSKQSALLNNELVEAEAASGRFQRNVGNYPNIGEGIISTFKKVGETFLTAFAVTAVISKVTRGFRNLINLGADFSRIQSTLKALNEGGDIDNLVNDARSLGAATEFTTTQVGNLQISLTKLGFRQDEILEATAATLDLATATGEDLAEAGTVAVKTLRAFGLDADQTRRVTDVLAVSFIKSSLNLETFRESIKTVAPVAKTLGFSLEGVTSLLAGLADVGIEGSRAGTSLRNILLKLADPTSELSKTFGTNINTSEKLIGVLRTLRDEGASLGEVLELTDTRSVAAFSTFIDNADKIEDLGVQFENAAGSAAAMAAIIRDDLRGDLDTASSATEAFALNIFDTLEPAIRTVVQGFTAFIRVLSGGLDLIQQFPALFGAISAALGVYTASLIANRLNLNLNTLSVIANNAAYSIGFKLLVLQETATKALNVVTGLLTGKIQLQTVAQIALNAATKLFNPVGLALGIGALVGGLIALASSGSGAVKELTELEKLEGRLGKRREEAEKQIGTEVAQVDLLFESLKNANEGSAERSNLIDAINDQYGEYLPNLLTESSNLKEIESAQLAVNLAIEANLIAKLKKQAIEEELGDVLKDQLQVSKELQEVTGLSGIQLRNSAKELDGLRDPIDALINRFAELSGRTDLVSDAAKGATISVRGLGGVFGDDVLGQGVKNTIGNFNDLRDALETQTLGIGTDIDAVNSEIARLGDIDQDTEITDIFVQSLNRSIKTVNELKNANVELSKNFTASQGVLNSYVGAVDDFENGLSDSQKASINLATSLSTQSREAFDAEVTAERLGSQWDDVSTQFGGAGKASFELAVQQRVTTNSTIVQQRELGLLTTSVGKSREILQQINQTYGSLTGVLTTNTKRIVSNTKADSKKADQLAKTLDSLNKRIAKERELSDVEEAGGRKSIEGLEVLRAQALGRLNIKLEGFEKERQALIQQGVDESTILQVTEEERALLFSKLNLEFDERVVKARGGAAQKRIEAESEALDLVLQERLKGIEAARLAELNAIDIAGQLTVDRIEDIEDEKFEIELEADKKRLDASLQFVEDQLKIVGLSAEETLKLEQERIAILLDIRDGEIDEVTKQEERKREEIEKTLEFQRQALDSLVNFAGSIREILEFGVDEEIALINERDARRQEGHENQLTQLEQEFAARERNILKQGLDAETEASLLASLNTQRNAQVAAENKRRADEEKRVAAAIKKAEQRREAAIAFEKKIQAIQAVIDNAQIIRNNIVTLSNNIKAVSEGAKIPFPGNIAAIISIIAAVAAGIASIRSLTASATSFELGGDTGLLFADGGPTPIRGRTSARSATRPPKRRKGYGGMHVGPRHSRGGIPIEVEGGEYENNRWSTELFYPLLSWMNHQGIRRKQGKPYGDMSSLFGMVKSSGSGVVANIPRVPVKAPKYKFQTGGAVPTGISEASTSVAFAELRRGFDNLGQDIQGVKDSVEKVITAIDEQELTLSLIEQKKQQLKLDRQVRKSEF